MSELPITIIEPGGPVPVAAPIAAALLWLLAALLALGPRYGVDLMAGVL